MNSPNYDGFISLIEANDVRAFTVWTDEDLAQILLVKAAQVVGTNVAIN